MGKSKKGMLNNLVINRYTLWTIPNILVFLRILCVPVYMTLLILGSRAGEGNNYAEWWVFLALGIMVFAALTDVFDGKIARKYKAGTKIGKYTVKHDQGTYVGQCIDPIADKCMHIGAIVALAISGYLHWAFIIFIVFRELCMIVIGSFIVNDIDIKANMLGKVASAIISSGIILCFFHKYICQYLWGVFSLDWIVVTIGLILNWAAAVNYAVDASKQYKANKLKTANDENGTEETVVEESEQKENATEESVTEKRENAEIDTEENIEKETKE